MHWHPFSSAKVSAWRKEVNTSSVSLFLNSGEDDGQFVSKLQASTNTFLGQDNAAPSDASDKKLARLIEEYTKKTGCRDEAVIACFHALTPAAAVQYLVFLKQLDITRYLRCVTLAHQINPDVVSSVESESAKALLQLSARPEALDALPFVTIFANASELWKSTFMKRDVVHNALKESRFFELFNARLDKLTAERRLCSAFKLVSWLQWPQVTDAISRDASLLEKFFPAWRSWALWHPNYSRLQLWEHYTAYTTDQRRLLTAIFDLEGPDNVSSQFPTLKRCSPACFQHVKVNPLEESTIDRLLDTLDRILMSSLGTAGVDLFIYFCVHQPADDMSFRYLDAVLDWNDPVVCRDLVGLFKTVDGVLEGRRSPSKRDAEDESSTLLAQNLLSITTLLRKEELSRSSELLPVKTVITAVERTIKEASDLLNNNWSSKSAIIAINLMDLGRSLVQCSWLGPALSNQHRDWVAQFPPTETIQACLDYMQHFGFSGTICARLSKCVSGKLAFGKGKEVLPELLEAEFDFWAARPSDERANLANTLSNIPLIHYDTYIQCLHSMAHRMGIFDVKQMHAAIEPPSAVNQTVSFARHLSNPFLHFDTCWKDAFVQIINSQASDHLHDLAASLSPSDWKQLITDICDIVKPDQINLPQSGTGVTKQLLDWWAILTKLYSHAVEILASSQASITEWLYLYEGAGLTKLLDTLQHLDASKLQMRVLKFINITPVQADNVANLLKLINSMSAQRTIILGRLLDKYDSWPTDAAQCFLMALVRSEDLAKEDKYAFLLLAKIVELPRKVSKGAFRRAVGQTQATYNSLIEQTRQLEMTRVRIERKRGGLVTANLKELGIEAADASQVRDPLIPEDIMDACEMVDSNTYELCFALNHLNELQRQARGIPDGAKLLLVRVCFKGTFSFCVHLTPTEDESEIKHTLWQAGGLEPNGIPCGANACLFTYWVTQNVHQMMSLFNAGSNAESTGKGTTASADSRCLKLVHQGVSQLINSAPSTCISCCRDLGTVLWKPTTCSESCRSDFALAPLEAQLHGFLLDPDTVDLLLTCVYAAAADTSNLDLLPGCPVPKSDLRQVIDSFPALSWLVQPGNLRETIRGDGPYAQERVDLLSWLCTAFQGFMVSASGAWRIPSMPETRQFLLVNSSHERQAAFQEQVVSLGASNAVFHGTSATRLFLILTQGLKVMSNTPYQIHGAYGGTGVYSADEQNTAWAYTSSTGTSWKNSALSNRRILLGCELAGYEASSTDVHVISVADRMLVRYVFLCPETYKTPPRRHVEQALNSQFAKLRSGAG